MSITRFETAPTATYIGGLTPPPSADPRLDSKQSAPVYNATLDIINVRALSMSILKYVFFLQDLSTLINGYDNAVHYTNNVKDTSQWTSFSIGNQSVFTECIITSCGMTKCIMTSCDTNPRKVRLWGVAGVINATTDIVFWVAFSRIQFERFEIAARVTSGNKFRLFLIIRSEVSFTTKGVAGLTPSGERS